MAPRGARVGSQLPPPDVLCALGVAQLRKLAGFKRRRAEIVAAYNAAFADLAEVATPPCREGADPMWHLYPLRILDGRRRHLYDDLRARSILVQVNYLPVYWHPAFEDLGYPRGLCPNAEMFYAQQLSLPLFPAMRDSDVDRVISSVRGFFGEG
ncbi:MAG: DegT/DnrJ/EryC1/StrS family aminotransferase [Nocardioidaceae bacterium]